MHAIHLLGLMLGLAFAGAAYAQASMQPDDERQRKKATAPASSTPPKPEPADNRENEYTVQPYRPRTERDYEPWPRQRNPATTQKSTPTPKTQPVTNAATPAQARDPALARCDEFKRRMERVIREESRGGDPARTKALAAERQKIYQEGLRAGC